MNYRFIIFIILLSSCHRKVITEVDRTQTIGIDTFNQKNITKEIPPNTLQDVLKLIHLGFESKGKNLRKTNIKMYFDPQLQDSIHIQCLQNDTVFLTIGNNQNKKVALYSYLDLLGYRFYGPEDHWTFIPKLPQYCEIDTLIASTFLYRQLAPTYGVSRSSTPALDSSATLFNRWKDRLRMANLIKIPSGHYGSAFNRKYKSQIMNHPEWRGKNKSGDFRKWSSGLKLCYNHPEVIALYKKDALERLKSLRQKSTPPHIINMEPPDGGEYCECEDCKIPVSDQVFGLANKIAKYLSDYDPHAIVSLYSYNRHAPVPSFPLEKNVIVGIVPYAFQGIGSPEVMMKQWESVGAKLYIRDYITIPIWNQDKTDYNPNGNFLRKIDHIKKAGYLGYNFETTSSFMAVGLQFYLLSQDSWKATNEKEEFDLFLDRLFPGYQDEISLIYENLPRLNSQNFPDAMLKIENLVKVAEKSGEKSILKRMEDLRFYIEYLYLLNQYNSKSTNNNLNLLLDKIMSRPGKRLLHPYGLYRTLKSNKALKSDFSLTENVPVRISSSKDITFSLRRSKKPSYQALYPEFYLDSVSSLPEIPIRSTEGILYVGTNHDGKVKFRAMLKRLNENASGTIIIRDMDGNHIKDISLVPDNISRDFTIKLKPAQFYTVQFRTPGAELFFQGPNRPFAFSKPLYTRYIHKQIPFYFRIPNNLNDVKIKVPLKSDKVVVKSEDQNLYTRNEDGPYVLDIIDKEGKIIEVKMYRHGLKLLNMPQLLSLNRKGIIYETP